LNGTEFVRGIVGAEACLLMDAPMPTAVVRYGLQQPVLWFTRDAKTMRLERHRSGGWSEADIREHQATMQATYAKLQCEGHIVEIPGTFHVNFTDVPYWSPLLSRLGVTGPINGQRAHQIINAYTLAFFDRHLLGEPAVLFNGPTEQYPEVRFETRPLDRYC
jgi:hypothetical protein